MFLFDVCGIINFFYDAKIFQIWSGVVVYCEGEQIKNIPLVRLNVTPDFLHQEIYNICFKLSLVKYVFKLILFYTNILFAFTQH